MTATAILIPQDLAVDPGGEATCEVRVRNTGTVVDEFRLDVLGQAAAWASVEPPVLRLFPGAEDTATVRFRPPRSYEVPAAVVPVGVRVFSAEEQTSAVAEAYLRISEFVDVVAEVVPRTSHGRRSALHQLAVDNRGNRPMDVRVTGQDPDDLMDFAVRPENRFIDPGTAAFFRVRAKPRRRFWRGPPVTRQFQLLVEQEDRPPLPVDATMLQDRMLPKWVLPSVALLAAAALLLVAGWFVLLKPQINSAAKEAAQEVVAETAKKAANAEKAAQAAQQAAADAKASGDKAAGDVEDIVAAGGVSGPPFDRRLAAADKPANQDADPNDAPAPGSEDGNTSEYVVPKNKILVLSDLVFENPQGDVGTLQLLRDDNTPESEDDGTLINLALQNFRTFDLHYAAPIEVRGGQRVRLLLDCQQLTQAGDNTCKSAVGLTGFLRSKPKPDNESEPSPNDEQTQPSN
ncbi:MAG: hypothetical protein GEV03_22845 [Streptosporangiales bacterium]|nr:hypothetical protein [Streptosporangiales bacterium]